jgi:hypothetical protein
MKTRQLVFNVPVLPNITEIIVRTNIMIVLRIFAAVMASVPIVIEQVWDKKNMNVDVKKDLNFLLEIIQLVLISTSVKEIHAIQETV